MIKLTNRIFENCDPSLLDTRSRLNLRIIHEVVDLSHSHSTHIHKEDEPQKHQIMFRRHPQHKLQIKRIQLRQQELQINQRKWHHFSFKIIMQWLHVLLMWLTMKIIPNTASHLRRLDAGRHSNFTQLYGVNWKAIRLIFPLKHKIAECQNSSDSHNSLDIFSEGYSVFTCMLGCSTIPATDMASWRANRESSCHSICPTRYTATHPWSTAAGESHFMRICFICPL